MDKKDNKDKEKFQFVSIVLCFLRDKRVCYPKYFKKLKNFFNQSMDYWIISEKHSYILIIGIYKRYDLLKKESEHFDNKENQDIDLRLADTQKLNIKKALKRGIYQELHNRNYLSDAQLNELIRKNT